MKISHLIEHLEVIKEREGDVEVYCLNSTEPIDDTRQCVLTGSPYRTTIAGFKVEGAPYTGEKCVRVLP
jgi:hypothetical protein